MVRAIEGLRNHQVVAGERNHLVEFEIQHAESNIVPIFGIVVERAGVLALVLRAGCRLLIVERASRIRRREDVEKSYAIGTQTALRDYVVWERRADVRILDYARSIEENVRTEEFAKVALAHGGAGHKLARGQIILQVLTEADVLLPKQEKELVPIGVKDSRYGDRTADVKAELVELERSSLAVERRIGIIVTRPLVRVEGRVAEVLVSRAVEILRAALRHDADLAAGRPAVFGIIVCGQDLHFLG